MLIASVSVYVISYAPAQIPLFYNLITMTPFRSNWTYHVLLMTLSYVNSAVNPLIYSVFSHNFRHQFRRLLCAVCPRRQSDTAEGLTVLSERRQIRHNVRTSQSYRMKRHATSPATDDEADHRIIVTSDRD